MKALIVSDSHGLEEELAQVIERHRGEVDVLIHCGDSELTKNNPILREVKTVKGNCDIGPDFPEEWQETIHGCSVYITHGHLYNVKATYVPLSYRGEELEADLVCFGHSHVADVFEENGIVYINPGSLRLPKNTNKKTYCICEWTSEGTTVSFYEQAGMPIEKLNKFIPIKK